jgi:hypothetical protein
MHKPLACLAILLAALCLPGCKTPAAPNPIVGTWFVDDIDAPFRYHMYVFNADGTMQQANPDAGDANTSDSDGKGIWVADGDRIKGKWVEITADRTTHKFVSRGELSFDLAVTGDSFTGTLAARFYDPQGKLIQSESPSPLSGKRVTLP